MVGRIDNELSSAPSCGLPEAVLLTLAYGDLFDYPLDEEECFRYLVGPCTSASLKQTIADLENCGKIKRDGDLLCLVGREDIVQTRRHRKRLAAQRWPAVLKFAGWLERVPFVRMVAVCGSHAVENADSDGDVDLFIITAPERVWLAQCLVMLLKRGGRILGLDICPNFILSEHALKLEQRNLYTAHEVAQAIPLWGEDAYCRFIRANQWVRLYLPQTDYEDREYRLRPWRRRPGTRLLEKALSGRMGDTLDRVLYKALMHYYILRLRRRGWGRDDIQRAYQRDRQTVIRGGFMGAIRLAFEQRSSEVLDGQTDLARDTFDGGEQTTERPDPLYLGLYAKRYGRERTVV